MDLMAYLSERSKPALLAVAFGLVGVVGVIDYLTVRPFSFELFYVVPQTGKLMAVEVNGDKLSTPKTLFQIQGDTGSAGVNWFVVRSDGQRFLVAETQKESWGVRLVVNWQMLSLKATH